MYHFLQIYFRNALQKFRLIISTCVKVQNYWKSYVIRGCSILTSFQTPDPWFLDYVYLCSTQYLYFFQFILSNFKPFLILFLLHAYSSLLISLCIYDWPPPSGLKSIDMWVCEIAFVTALYLLSLSKYLLHIKCI